MINFAKIQASYGNEIHINGEPPADIQWMPPGEHSIVASKDDKPTKLTVEVSEEIVEALNKSLEEIKAQGFDAYIDFNHNDENASGWVEGFFWGGDDPGTGGIRAKIRWSHEGAEALKGGSYKRFSPTFLTDAKGRVIGTTPNAGGLVNRPAFRSIAAVMAAKDINETDLRFVSASEMPDKERKEETTKGTKMPDYEDKIKKLEAEKEELMATIKDMKAKYKAGMEENEKMKKEAKARDVADLVSSAIKDGKVAAKDDKAINALKAVADGNLVAAKDLIEAMPVLAKAQEVLTGRITPANPDQVAAKKPSEVMHNVIAEIMAKNPAISGEDAFRLARESKPEVFNS